MGLAERRRGSRGVLVNVRAARALVLALAVALPAAGQSAVSAAVAVRPQEVVIGHEVQVEIRLRGVDLARMQIVPPVFVGLVPAGDPEPSAGPEGPVVTYRLQASRRGRHTLGSFVIRTPGSLVVTAPLQVTVLGRAEAAAAEPVLRWRLDTTTPFVWEGVTAVLELIAPAPLPLVGPALVELAAPLDLQPLPAGSGISALDGSDRYVIPVARYRLTARVAGRTVLPGGAGDARRHGAHRGSRGAVGPPGPGPDRGIARGGRVRPRGGDPPAGDGCGRADRGADRRRQRAVRGAPAAGGARRQRRRHGGRGGCSRSAQAMALPAA